MDHSPQHQDDFARLSGRTYEALRTTAEARRQGRPPGSPERQAIREISREAHTSEIAIERFLIICKDAWRAIPEARQLPRDVAEETLSKVITLCIHDFYACDGGSDGDSGIDRRVRDEGGIREE